MKTDSEDKEKPTSLLFLKTVTRPALSPVANNSPDSLNSTHVKLSPK